MIVEYIRYKVDLDRAEPFVQAYQLASRALDQSEFCRAYELSECTENKRFFVLRILWDSLEAHLEGFRKSRDFSGFFAAVKPFVDDIEEMRHYALTPDGSDPPEIRSPRNVPTLYQWAGGIERVEALFKRFYERVALDSTLRPVFAELPAQHFQTSLASLQRF